MSRRRNGTNRAGAAIGMNPHGWGNGGRRKRAAGAGTPSGNQENKFQDNCNIQVSEEQAKMQKILNLVRLALEINGFSKRLHGVTGDLPTIFFSFSGHVANMSIDCNRNGWRVNERGESKDVYFNDEDFDDEYTKILTWLQDIKAETEAKLKGA